MRRGPRARAAVEGAAGEAVEDLAEAEAADGVEAVVAGAGAEEETAVIEEIGATAAGRFVITRS